MLAIYPALCVGGSGADKCCLGRTVPGSSRQFPFLTGHTGCCLLADRCVHYQRSAIHCDVQRRMRQSVHDFAWHRQLPRLWRDPQWGHYPANDAENQVYICLYHARDQPFRLRLPHQNRQRKHGIARPSPLDERSRFGKRALHRVPMFEHARSIAQFSPLC